MSTVNRDEWIVSRVDAVRRHMPPEFADAQPDPRLAPWIDAHLAGDHRSLLLQGPVGTGKTHAAWSVWPALITAGWVGAFRATTESRYLADLLPGGDRGRATACETADVLLLDDLGLVALNDWNRAALHALVDTRWSQHLPLIVTTNLTGRQLAERLGERTASRFSQHATVLTMTGPDRRRS